ncbi:MAG: GNAT family N-acetyltransferase [Spirochaetota bacterium]
MQIKYRSVLAQDYLFLTEMLYQALFIPPGQKPFPKSVIETPELGKYIKDWGKQIWDVGFLATVNSKKIAATWGHAFHSSSPGYGYIDEHTPEITLAVQKEYRNQGIGRELLKRLLAEYKRLGCRQVSLSVSKQNPAKSLYVRFGFEVQREEGDSLVMCKSLTEK